MPRFLSGRVGRALLLGLAVSLGVSALSRVGALAGWETRAVDTFLALRDRGTAPDLVIVSGARVTVRSRGAVPVKGRADPVDVYEVVGLAGEREVRDATARVRSPE